MSVFATNSSGSNGENRAKAVEDAPSGCVTPPAGGCRTTGDHPDRQGQVDCDIPGAHGIPGEPNIDVFFKTTMSARMLGFITVKPSAPAGCVRKQLLAWLGGRGYEYSPVLSYNGELFEDFLSQPFKNVPDGACFLVTNSKTNDTTVMSNDLRRTRNERIVEMQLPPFEMMQASDFFDPPRFSAGGFTRRA